ncbi:MAG: alpha/beta hydrolase [Chloroflexi bacterium]|nr:MAG: alpha/beta hydrolase [Chloroflexota bacterium]
MAEREVRYCTTEDGVRIAYCVEGAGPPLLAALGIESFALDHLFPENAAFFQRLCETFTVIRYDLRGVGLSDRFPEVIDVSSLGKDLDAVAAAAGIQRFALFTYLTSGPVALEWAIRHQGILSHLILFETLAAYSRLFSAELVQSVGEMARAGAMGFVAQSFANEPMRRQFPVQAGAVAKAIADSIDGEVYARLFASVQPLDVSGQLAELRVPTLVLNRQGDPFFNPSLVRSWHVPSRVRPSGCWKGTATTTRSRTRSLFWTPSRRSLHLIVRAHRRTHRLRSTCERSCSPTSLATPR